MNIEQFPSISVNQVVLLSSAVSNGHVLDENLQLVTNEHQKVYTVFPSKEEAEIAANKIISERDDVEFVLYGKDKLVLKYIQPG